jgi:hypothetical protein
MTSDKGVVERLRDGAIEIDNDGTASQVGPTADDLREAAARIETLERALRPFVAPIEASEESALARAVDPVSIPDDEMVYSFRDVGGLTVGDFRRARAALSPEK